jgi:hypothetical protein
MATIHAAATSWETVGDVSLPISVVTIVNIMDNIPDAVSLERSVVLAFEVVRVVPFLLFLVRVTSRQNKSTQYLAFLFPSSSSTSKATISYNSINTVCSRAGVVVAVAALVVFFLFLLGLLLLLLGVGDERVVPKRAVAEVDKTAMQKKRVSNHPWQQQ